MTPEQLAEIGVRAIALVLVDNGGIARMKCVPIDRLAHAAAKGIGWSEVWGLALSDDSFSHDPDLYTPSGELRLRADLAAAAPLGSEPGWAWAPVDHHHQDGRRWAGCQRWFLSRMVERARTHGIEVQAAWELEWSVADEGPAGIEALHQGPGYGAVTFGQTASFMLDLFDGLAGSGVSPHQVHPEYADGQMELSLPPADPVAACDQSLLARQVIRSVAAQAGWRASFAPRIVAGSVGNGAHVHVSIWRDGANLLAGGEGPAGLQPEGAAFLAGMLSALPALLAIGAPTALSYHRLQPSRWAGAYAFWGDENREAALRMQAAGSSGANVEWKSPDGAANPYLALGALLAAGLDGLERSLEPPPPLSADPEMLPEHERPPRLPLTLAEATSALVGSDVLRDAMGAYLFDRVVAVRSAEVESAAGLDEEALVAKYRWRF